MFPARRSFRLRALQLSSVSCGLPQATRGSSRSNDFAPGRVRPTGCVLSDIVKRRSLRALLWMKIQSGAQSPCTARECVIAATRRASAVWRDGAVARSADLSAGA